MSALQLIVPPPVVAIACGLGINYIAKKIPAIADFTIPPGDVIALGEHTVPANTLVAAGIAAVGLSMAISAQVLFRQAGTTPSPFAPNKSSKLVDTGIYRITRNPMYLGLATILTGVAVWVGNPVSGVLGVAGFISYITAFQILPEERILATKFGAEYDAYKKRVPRWLFI